MKSITRVKEILKTIPGIGEKSSERIVYYLLTEGRDTAMNLSEELREILNNLKICSVCGGITDIEPCSICSSNKRQNDLLMVVETAKDIIVFEKSNYNGKYHVLNGLISPMNNMHPENLSIEKLEKRVRNEKIDEIIIALPPTTEGEATMLYISKIFFDMKIKISHLAFGIPFGTKFEYIDDYNLQRSLKNRINVDS